MKKQWLVLAGCLMLAGRVGAEIPAGVVLDPWEAGTFVETTDDFLFEGQGHVSNTDTRTHLFYWDSMGRIRFDKQDQWSPAVAYHLLMIDTGIHAPAGSAVRSYLTTSTLNDLAVAGQVALYKEENFHVGLIAGVGYAGNSPFNDDQAAYGIGHLVAERKLNGTDALAVTVDYEGNGAFLPDVPLPGFGYIHRGETLEYMVGYPADSFKWKPIEKLTIEGSYYVPYTAQGTVSYEVLEGLKLYTMVGNVFQGFKESNDESHNRVFFQMSRAEVGARYAYKNWFDVSAGLGYAFSQNFMRGFDVRDLTDLNQMSNRPYVGVMLRSQF